MINQAPATNIAENESLNRYCAVLRQQFSLNRRLLFVQIPHNLLSVFNRETALQRGYYAFPPTGLQYLYEAIRDRGFEVRILDINYELLVRVHEQVDFDPANWLTILDDALEEFEPSIVGVSCMFDMAISALIETLERIRTYGRSITISGGVIATYEWKTLIGQHLSHFVVRGEGENKLNFLLDNILGEVRDRIPVPGGSCKNKFRNVPKLISHSYYMWLWTALASRMYRTNILLATQSENQYYQLTAAALTIFVLVMPCQIFTIT